MIQSETSLVASTMHRFNLNTYIIKGGEVDLNVQENPTSTMKIISPPTFFFLQIPVVRLYRDNLFT